MVKELLCRFFKFGWALPLMMALSMSVQWQKMLWENQPTSFPVLDWSLALTKIAFAWLLLVIVMPVLKKKKAAAR
jgi:hypothetical protein